MLRPGFRFRRWHILLYRNHVSFLPPRTKTCSFRQVACRHHQNNQHYHHQLYAFSTSPCGYRHEHASGNARKVCHPGAAYTRVRAEERHKQRDPVRFLLERHASVGLSFGRPFGRSVVRSFGRWAGRLINWYVGRSINR